ncbi:hypothetical protein AK812_SmicGene15550 [Symbiodinium microadriaticum]|uniref:Uncharacterized protein n=1 Tax=Symbiodinium microadriaticum TaxID=2951 RepID=A0A1Q9E2L3_SYMMI|nr:hypothetical protein AK812_SmicGene15550 [Symbiodinium microadriaticum]CAE7217179.1 unnamed protein product [Symbiodinium sp. KB8]CAE7901138.1 unnamed protein product [Symbiodinium microadriaticum]
MDPTEAELRTVYWLGPEWTALRVQELDADGNAAGAPRETSLVEKARLEAVRRVGLLRMGATPDGPGAPKPAGPAPVAAPAVSPSATGSRKLKLSAVLDPTLDADVTAMEHSELQRLYFDYKTRSYVTQFGDVAWWIIYRAENRVRAEQMERLRPSGKAKRKYTGEDQSTEAGDVYILNRKGITICEDQGEYTAHFSQAIAEAENMRALGGLRNPGVPWKGFRAPLLLGAAFDGCLSKPFTYGPSFWARQWQSFVGKSRRISTILWSVPEHVRKRRRTAPANTPIQAAVLEAWGLATDDPDAEVLSQWLDHGWENYPSAQQESQVLKELLADYTERGLCTLATTPEEDLGAAAKDIGRGATVDSRGRLPHQLGKANGGKVIDWVGARIECHDDEQTVVVTLPAQKISQLADQVEKMLGRSVVGAREPRSLAGSPSFVAGLVPHLRPFLSAFWAMLTKFELTSEGKPFGKARKLIHTRRIAPGLRWVRALLQAGTLRKTFLANPPHTDFEIVTDASPWGIGGILRCKGEARELFFSCHPDTVLHKFGAERGVSKFNTLWEGLALLVAFRLWLPTGQPIGQSPTTAARGSAKSPALNVLAREFALDEALRIFSPEPKHFPPELDHVPARAVDFAADFWKV